MRTLFSLLFLVVSCSIPFGANSEEMRQVKCDIHLASSRLQPGGTGEILVSFSPEEGIHINTDPAIEFAFDKDPLVHFTDSVSMPKMAKTGYLDTKRPVRYTFTVDKKMPKGKHTLKGAMKYFFCSDAEGWCTRSSQPIELTFSVSQ